MKLVGEDRYAANTVFAETYNTLGISLLIWCHVHIHFDDSSKTDQCKIMARLCLGTVDFHISIFRYIPKQYLEKKVTMIDCFSMTKDGQS